MEETQKTKRKGKKKENMMKSFDPNVLVDRKGVYLKYKGDALLRRAIQKIEGDPNQDFSKLVCQLLVAWSEGWLSGGGLFAPPPSPPLVGRAQAGNPMMPSTPPVDTFDYAAASSTGLPMDDDEDEEDEGSP